MLVDIVKKPPYVLIIFVIFVTSVRTHCALFPFRTSRYTGSEIPNECARQVNQFIEPGSLQTPIAFVDKPSEPTTTAPTTSRGRGTCTLHPRTGSDIGYMDGKSWNVFFCPSRSEQFDHTTWAVNGILDRIHM